VIKVPTLDDVPTGLPVVVQRPRLDPAYTRRLAELGIRHGALVSVLMRTVGGAGVITVDNSRIALDSRTMRQIPVASQE
jgi:Fe2+ transport system protein FeoA